MVAEIETLAGPGLARQHVSTFSEAVSAYEGDRYAVAHRLLAGLARVLPGSPAVRELFGLCLYREGRFAAALRELEEHHRRSGSFDQYPVMADCHRALGHHDRVEQLWSELGAVSPGAEVVAEGRIVMAGSLAERGDLARAMALLERSRRARHGARPRRSPPVHEVRQWYALADLYERAGELVRARELFEAVADADPDLSDARGRLAALS